MHMSMPKTFALINIFLVVVLHLLSGCTLISPIWPQEETNFAGTASGMFQTPLPPDAKLHVLLRKKNPSSGEHKIIANQTIDVSTEKFSIPFSLGLATKAIKEDHIYSLQACVTVNGTLRMVSHPDNFVLTQGFFDTAEIHLIEYSPWGNGLEFTDWTAQSETALQSSVQTNLSGICKSTMAGYDTIFIVTASEILTPEWLSGPHHKVREQVTLRGPHYYFDVDSDYGTFSVQGMAMLRRLVREIQAIERMSATKRTKAFKDALSDTALVPFGEFKDFILHPQDTLGGIVKGAAAFVQSTTASLTQKRSEYEDRYIEALVTVSKYKRKYASQLAIDVYSSNPKTQEEMNRLGWAAALGNWSPAAVLYPFTGAAKIIYSAFSWSDTLNRLITEEAPDKLRFHNNRLMTAMAIPEELRKEFLSHPFYSPRHQTVIVGSLDIMKETLGKEQFIRQALAAKSEIDAFTFQQLAELLAGFHKTQAPIAKIFEHKGIPVGYTHEKELVMMLPADIGRWTPFSKNIFTEFGSEMSEEAAIHKKILWITGTATEKFKQNMARLGITFKDDVGDILKMMD